MAEDDSTWLFEQAMDEFNRKSYLKSLMYCDKGLEEDPEDRDFLEIKAFSLAELDRFDEALKTAEILIKRLPGIMEPQALKGYILASAGRRDEAKLLIDTAVRSNPNNFMIKILAAYGYAAMGDDMKTVVRATDVLKEAPDSYDMLILKRNSLSRMGKNPEAMVFWDRALKVRYAEAETVTINLMDYKDDLVLRLCQGDIIEVAAEEIEDGWEEDDVKVDEKALIEFMKDMGFIIKEKEGKFNYTFKKIRARS